MSYGKQDAEIAAPSLLLRKEEEGGGGIQKKIGIPAEKEVRQGRIEKAYLPNSHSGESGACLWALSMEKTIFLRQDIFVS